MALALWAKQEQERVKSKIAWMELDIYFSTFAKSMAGIGAFIGSAPHVIKFLRYNMRSQIYAKSLPMPMVIGALKRLELNSHPTAIERPIMECSQCTPKWP